MKRKETNKLSIIIVNYDTNSYALNCIQSVYNQTQNIEIEIVLVDNNSPNDNPEIIVEKFPKIKLIVLKENIGFAGACNIGIKNSKFDYILLLNPDIQIKNNAIEVLMNYLIRNIEIGAVGGWLKDEQGKIIHSYDDFFVPKIRLITEAKKLIKKALYLENKPIRPSNKILKEEKELIKEVDYITGADLLFSKKIWEALGGISEKYFMYFEEQDFQMKMKKMNLKRVLVSGTEIIHFHSKSMKSNNHKRLLITRASIIFVSEHFYGKWFIYKILLLFIVICNFIVDLYRSEFSINENISLIKTILCTRPSRNL